MTSPQSIVVFNENTQLNTPDDLRNLTNNPEMDELIKGKFANIDIAKTFEDLVDCGKMLQIALTAAGDQPCSLDILEILSKYQDLVHESTVTSHKFVNASLGALLRHRDAMELLGLTEPQDLVEMLPDILDELAKCYDTAREMQAEAATAASNVDVVKKLAENGFKSAKTDLNLNAKQNKEVQHEIDTMKAEQESSAVLLAKYSKAVTELGEEKREAAREAATARDRAFALDITSAVLGSVGELAEHFATGRAPAKKEERNDNSTPQQTSGDATLLNPELAKIEKDKDVKQKLLKEAKDDPDADTPDGKKKIEKAEEELNVANGKLENVQNALSQASQNQQQNARSHEENASRLSNMYYQMMESEAAEAALQAKNLQTLKTMRTNKTFIEQTIFLLQFSYGILGKVKTTFLNVRTFWELLAIQCQQIADMKQDIVKYGEKTIATGGTKEVYKKTFEKRIIRGTLSWASVGRVSLNASDAISKAKSTVDGVMMALPSGEVTEKDLNALINTIEPRIRQKVLETKSGANTSAIED